MMQVNNEMEWAGWAAVSDDPYSSAVFRYAERWAGLMEGCMADGEAVPECAKRTGREADVEGITAFQYGCAVSALSLCWVHGEELRRWHNLATQVGDEGERANEKGTVLNPALLCIEVT